MEKKTAAYICSGCGIGDAVNIDELVSLTTGDLKVPICRTHANLCSQEGAALIKQDMDKEGANALIIAACSPRVMYDVFNFENCIVDRVNLREQVAWSQPAGDENTQMMAADYLRMSAAKVAAMELPVPYKPEKEISKTLLVVRRGPCRMTSAVEASKPATRWCLSKGSGTRRFSEKGGADRHVPLQGRGGEPAKATR